MQSSVCPSIHWKLCSFHIVSNILLELQRTFILFSCHPWHMPLFNFILYSFYFEVDNDNNLVTARPNDVIPGTYLRQIHDDIQAGSSFEEAVRAIRLSQVPPRYQPCPFREGLDDTLLDILRSILATMHLQVV